MITKKKQTDSLDSKKCELILFKNRPLKITKLYISRGINKANTSEVDKYIEESLNEFKFLTGQKPKLIYAKKHIAGFNIRKGMIIGLSVTLRNKKKNNFLKKFINLILPNANNFNGIALKNFDKKGNITFGISSQKIVPDLPYIAGQAVRGFNITLTTNAKNSLEGLTFLSSLGFPRSNSSNIN